MVPPGGMSQQQQNPPCGRGARRSSIASGTAGKGTSCTSNTPGAERGLGSQGNARCPCSRPRWAYGFLYTLHTWRLLPGSLLYPPLLATSKSASLLFTTQFSSHSLPRPVMLITFRGLMAQKAMARGSNTDRRWCSYTVPVLVGHPWPRQEGKALPRTCHHSATQRLPVPMDNPLYPPQWGTPERPVHSRWQHSFLILFLKISLFLQVLKHLLRGNVA